MEGDKSDDTQANVGWLMHSWGKMKYTRLRNNPKKEKIKLEHSAFSIKLKKNKVKL